ncbi:MAG: thioredoxin family protein [Tenericutes bacterium]|jgi:small redox-active disulfide protein 2|nr:thioredoxin family protein [Mycoplasmatota bacterium]
MIIKVLGSGCSNCKKLEKNVIEALKAMNKEATIEKVTEMKDIMSYNILSTPALVVDGKVLFSGQVPSTKKLQELLK